jgi:excisionase family DNA binding protein
MPSDELHDELSALLTGETTSRRDMMELAEAQAHVCEPGHSSFLEDLLGKQEYISWVTSRSPQPETRIPAKNVECDSDLIQIPSPGKFLTINQAAELLEMSTGNLRRHCICGNIEATKIGQRLWIIPESAIEAFRKQYPDERNRPGRKAKTSTLINE